MTHRAFSRNASSSRAIPIKTLIKDVMDDPFIPLHWGKHQKGMQAEFENDEPVLVGFTNSVGVRQGRLQRREQAWLDLRDKAVFTAQSFADAGYHKQIINRLIEPFAHISVVVTATNFANWFALRDHPAAEPHIQLLAKAMWEQYQTNIPKLLKYGDWHLPFVTDEEQQKFPLEQSVQASTARCARTSYRLHDGSFPPFEEDLKLYTDLMVSEPLHASPSEHQATPDSMLFDTRLHGNFRGWIQHRKLFPNENVADKMYDISRLSAEDQELFRDPSSWYSHNYLKSHAFILSKTENVD